MCAVIIFNILRRNQKLIKLNQNVQKQIEKMVIWESGTNWN